MNTLFDRYFLVLAGRLTKDHWGSVATPMHSGSGVITLRWPSDENESLAERSTNSEPVSFTNRSSS